MVQERGDGADDPGAISSPSCSPSPTSPWSDWAMQLKKANLQTVFVLSFFRRDIHVPHFLRRRFCYLEAHLIYNELCLLVCFYFILSNRIVFLHQSPHLQIDFPNFLPCLPILHHTKVTEDYRECLKMGSGSTTDGNQQGSTGINRTS